MCHSGLFIEMAVEIASSSLACKTLEGGATEPVPVWESLLFPAVDGNYYWVPSPWWVHAHTHTHIHTPTDTQSNIQTHAESFSKDKRHPVGLRKRKRKREGEGEKSSSGSLLLFRSLPLSLCTEETSLLSLHSPVSTVQLVLPLHHTVTRARVSITRK